MKKETRHLKYVFTTGEITEKGKNLADYNSQLKQLEDQKKATTSEFTSKIDSIKATINVESLKINQGFEFRNVNCHIEFHKPKDGMKTISRPDTGEVWEEKMTESDVNLFTELQQ